MSRPANPPRWCPARHDTRKVGRTPSNGECKACRNLRNKFNRLRAPKSIAAVPTLKELREARGTSAQELAHKVGVTLDVVRRWEAGHTRPTSRSRHALCEALNVDERQLTYGGTYPRSATGRKRYKTLPREKRKELALHEGTLTQTAKAFGVSRRTVSRIRAEQDRKRSQGGQ